MLLKKALIFALLGMIFLPHLAHAQSATLVVDTENFAKAKVLEVVTQSDEIIPSTEAPTFRQTLRAEILEGDQTGRVVEFLNDYVPLEARDIFYIRHQSNHLDDTDYWSVAEPYRLDTLLWLTILFVVLVAVFGGFQGVRGLASLIGSLVLIFYVLVPGIYGGYNAVLVSIGVTALIILVGSYITHGFNKTTTVAVIGMIITVFVTGALAHYVVAIAQLSGYSSDESMFLHLNTKGAIDMVGLLFGAIMIGLLGVLYDIAIAQAIAIEELFRAGKHLTRREVYLRGIRIGREHIGALVNTLAIAYVGASLPLLLLVQSSTTGVLFILNSEIFSTEIVRILIGSIGLVLAVPITTFIASYMLEDMKGKGGGGHVTHSH